MSVRLSFASCPSVSQLLQSLLVQTISLGVEYPGSRLVLEATISEFTALSCSLFEHEDEKNKGGGGGGGQAGDMMGTLEISLLHAVSSDVRREETRVLMTERASVVRADAGGRSQVPSDSPTLLIIHLVL